MRAKFIRGQDPKKALGIGKYSTVWGKIEDMIRVELKDLDTSMPYPLQHRNPKFFISRNGDRMGVFFPNSTEMGVHQLFQIFNSHALFHSFNDILHEYEDNAFIGANLSDPSYFEYDIPDELFIEGRFMEFFIQRR
jgi:hypothetical protein